MKTASSARLYKKKNITSWLEDMNVMFSWQELYLVRSPGKVTIIIISMPII